MCCDDNKVQGQTRIQGPMGTPVGYENFMEPGGPFGSEDVLGAIYAKMGLNDEPEEAMPPMVNPEDEEIRLQMTGGMQ